DDQAAGDGDPGVPAGRGGRARGGARRRGRRADRGGGPALGWEENGGREALRSGSHMRSTNSAMRRAPKPVGPGTNGPLSLSVAWVPAMSRWAQGMFLSTKYDRKAAPWMGCASRTGALLTMSAMGDFIMARYSSWWGRRQTRSPEASAAASSL